MPAPAAGIARAAADTVLAVADIVEGPEAAADAVEGPEAAAVGVGQTFASARAFAEKNHNEISYPTAQMHLPRCIAGYRPPRLGEGREPSSSSSSSGLVAVSCVSVWAPCFLAAPSLHARAREDLRKF